MISKIFIDRMAGITGYKRNDILQLFSYTRKGSFRVNTLSTTEEEVCKEFGEMRVAIAPVRPIPFAYTFDASDMYSVKGSTAFYQGKIYLQSIASMIPPILLNPKEGEMILDVCAAPGGKTTQMATQTNNTSKITALELHQIRFDKLVYNCRLQGATSVNPIKIDAEKFLQKQPPIWDKILLDVPCSAEGRISLEHPKSYGFWSLENIHKKATVQYQLLDAAFAALSAGGTLVYSTCTLAPEENEGLIARFLQKHGNAQLVAIPENINKQFISYDWWKIGNHIPKYTTPDVTQSEVDSVSQSTVRILPSKETEGFFCALLQKQK